MRRSLGAVATAMALSLFACNSDSTKAPASASVAPTSSAPAPTAADRARVDALLKAEVTRDFSAIKTEDLSHRDAAVRRQAARTLARLRDPRARQLLLRGLADVDQDVVAWSAYGLGDICDGHRGPTVSALVTTATAIEGRPPAKSRVVAERAIIRAIGKCAATSSEAALIGWARRRGPFVLDVIYALGDIARKHERLLNEDTYVGLLELAEGNAALPSIPEALYPIGRVENLTPSVIERTFEVAKAKLGTAGPGRPFAARALGRTDDRAIPLLAQVLTDPATYGAPERVEAARALARFGERGQAALQAALDKLIPSPDALVSPHIQALLVVFDSLTDTRKAKPALEKLARLPAPTDASEAVKRRLSWIRCGAAKLLAERNYTLPDLRKCDLAVSEADRDKEPLASSIGARAVVAAISVDGVQISGKRLEAWRAYAEGAGIRAREDALLALADHGEIADAAPTLIKALAAEPSGVVATAAEVIHKHPKRVGSANEALNQALIKLLDGKGPAEDHEALAMVIDAVGTLRVAAAKEQLVNWCGSPYAAIRTHAEGALKKIMGKASPKCPARKTLALPDELARRIDKITKVTFESDIGPLTIEVDPELAPIAATRAVDLAKNGFYGGMVVHRVAAGFVSQFGSPTFDGYGTVEGMPPLPCETSPIPYAPMSVGVALAGRDTGTSQLFVTHTPTPHLDGNYALIGTASGPWDALIDGDVLTKTKVH